MPTYEYACKSCGEHSGRAVVQGRRLTVCPLRAVSLRRSSGTSGSCSREAASTTTASGRSGLKLPRPARVAARRARPLLGRNRASRRRDVAAPSKHPTSCACVSTPARLPASVLESEALPDGGRFWQLKIRSWDLVDPIVTPVAAPATINVASDSYDVLQHSLNRRGDGHTADWFCELTTRISALGTDESRTHRLTPMDTADRLHEKPSRLQR